MPDGTIAADTVDRPSIHAALELGTTTFWEAIETLLTSTSLDFERTVHRLLPALSEVALRRCGRAIRRAICAALLDKSATADEIREELRTILDGYLNRIDNNDRNMTRNGSYTTEPALVPED